MAHVCDVSPFFFVWYVCEFLSECAKEIRTNQLYNAWEAKLSIVLFHQYLADLMYLYLLLGNDQTLGFQPLGLRCEA